MYGRYRFLILALFACAAPLVLYGSKQAWDNTSSRAEDWLPSHFEETQTLLEFLERFGSDETLIVSWPDCHFGDKRLNQLAAALKKPSRRPDSSMQPLFRHVFVGSEVLDAFTAEPLELSEKQALQRMQGWLAGADGRTTCAVALVSQTGMNNRAAAVDHVYDCAIELGLPPQDIHVAGTTVNGVAVDRISKDSMMKLNCISLLMCLLLIYIGFRSVRVALMIFFSAAFSQQLSMALVHFAGGRMDSVMLMMAALVFVLGISAAVHLVNYYADTVREKGLEGAPREAVAQAKLPCGLAACTTALGLVSLGISQIVPISRFGAYSACTVLAGLAVMFVFLPCALQQWPIRQWAENAPGGSTASKKNTSPTGLSAIWNRLASFVERHNLVITVATVALMVAACISVSNIKTTVRLPDLFSKEVPLIRDYKWLESNIGPLVPVEVVLTIPRGEPDSLLEHMIAVERVREAAAEVGVVGATISAATFAPELPRGRSARDTAKRAAMKRILARSRERFVDLRYLHDTADFEMWRISLKVPAIGKVEHGKLLEELDQRVQPVIEQLREEGLSGVEVEFAGGVPLFYRAQRQLLQDLVKSFLLAFALIGVAMIVLLRSVRAGVLSMIPNLLPSALVFGMMGASGREIGIGSLMTASAALGIAVDDTLHFIVWFRRGLARGDDRSTAVRFAYEKCGKAMMQTTLICGLGLSVFFFSYFQPTSEFSWLMGILLAAALLGDLILLPAILVGPLGRVFEKRS